MIAILGINLLGTSIAGMSALYGWGWSSAFFNILTLSVIFHLNAIRENNKYLLNVAYVATIAGFVELFADHWLVQGIGVLEYPQVGPFIADSPLYMPFCWAGMLLTFGLLGNYFSNRIGIVMGSILSSVIMGVYVPLYEQMAFSANWWSYKNSPSIGDVPLFIIIGEFLIGLPLTYLIRKSMNARREWLTVNGIIIGLWIWGSYWIAFNMTDVIFLDQVKRVLNY